LGGGILSVLQEGCSATLLELSNPKPDRDRVIIVQVDLLILDNLTEAVDITDCDVIITIHWQARILHAFLLDNSRWLGKLMINLRLTIALESTPT